MYTGSIKKRWGFKFFTVFFAFISVFAPLAPLGTVESAMISDTAPVGMKLAAENDKLQLYIDESTTCIAVRNKSDGAVWRSNPENAANDPLAGGINKERLNSQIYLTYYTPKNVDANMNNYSDSIKKGQYQIDYSRDGVKILYTIGSVEDSLLLPKILSESRMNEVLKDVTNEDDIFTLETVYKKVSITDKMKEEEKNQLLKDYPSLKNGSLYVLRDLKNKKYLSNAAKVFESIGYTEEMLVRDQTEMGLQDTYENQEVFKVPLCYMLDGGSLKVSIPLDEIECGKGYTITKIRMQEFFGAANTEEKGYMLLPDGSGSLLYLNNGKKHDNAYAARVYGRDRAVKAEQIVEQSDQAYLPVYGMKRDAQAFLAVIDGLDSSVDIYADVAGRLNSYNYVCPEFIVTPQDTLELGNLGAKSVNLFQKRMFTGNASVRYSFLSGKDADYVGMAKEYRQYLEKVEGMKKIKAGSEVPFYIELIGGVDKRKLFLGFPYNGYQKLTDYKEAEEIIELLKRNGIGNIIFKYSGWFNGGMRQSAPDKIKFQSQLGGEKGFSELADYLSANGIKFFPDVSFNYLLGKSLFDGISYTRDTSRFLSREIAEVYNYKPASFLEDKSNKSPFYILVPKKMLQLIDGFLKRSGVLHATGISTGSMGSDLNSDFTEKRLTDRKMAMVNTVTGIRKLQDRDYEIMTNGGNAYTLPYSRYILKMPVDSNRYYITDESIPFYQIAVRGLVEYTGEPVNLSFDIKRQMLKTIETGGGVYYTWTHADNSALKDTAYKSYYSVNYKDWMDRAAEFYKKVDAALGDVQGQTIEGHEKLADNVYKVTYEKGRTITVNYNSHAVSVDGKEIGPEDFVIGKEVQNAE